jgi:hypothetical protein
MFRSSQVITTSFFKYMKEESRDQPMLDGSETPKPHPLYQSVPINGYLSYIEGIKKHEKEQTGSS